MIDEERIRRIATHGLLHGMGMCTCPCYDALIEVGQKLMVEDGLRVAMAKASPEVLAAFTVGAAGLDDTPPEEDDDLAPA